MPNDADVLWCGMMTEGFLLLLFIAHVQVSSTFSVDEARRSYFGQLFPLNPGGIIPAGPTVQVCITNQ